MLSLGNAGYWTQDFMLGRQALYQVSYILALDTNILTASGSYYLLLVVDIFWPPSFCA